LFTLDHLQNQNKSKDYLELKNSDNSCFAKIDLTQGGSLQDLKFGGQDLLAPQNTSAYTSSILFPFANRIEEGHFSFNGNTFVLKKNEGNRNNAIHGLVFDKAFKLIAQEVSESSASITISYDETQPVSGFPFKYGIKLHYMLSKNALELKVEVENKDHSAFPFSLGWHPYFKTDDLFNSHLKMSSRKKILVNEKMIPNGDHDIEWTGFHQIKDQTFDDCFVLDTNIIEFKTSAYHFEFEFSTLENYLQLYTPGNRKSIAIEPQTAPANSFNNNIGLQVLKPNESYHLSWKITLK